MSGRTKTSPEEVKDLLEIGATYEQIRIKTGASPNFISKCKKELLGIPNIYLNTPKNPNYKQVIFVNPNFSIDEREQIIRCYSLHGNPNLKRNLKIS